ncbi:DUF3617 domain-containing protein [Acidovorax sp.]|uniref:DUF3617 domain-containing protein n=1 Tax=Acidovorax sp. TaxID=1872122 RepID=UPI00391B9E62
MRYPTGVFALCFLAWGASGVAHEAPHAGAKHTAAPVPNVPKASRQAVLPARKDGLWEVLVRSDDLVLKRAGRGTPQPVTVRQCTSAAVEPIMLMSIVPGQEDCHERKVLRRGKGAEAGHDIITVCYVHDNRVDTQMRLLGDLQSTYHGSFEAKFPKTPLHNTGRMVFEGRWLGDCAAGQRPGDMLLPNGVTVNVVDDHRRAQNADHSGHKH